MYLLSFRLTPPPHPHFHFPNPRPNSRSPSLLFPTPVSSPEKSLGFASSRTVPRASASPGTSLEPSLPPLPSRVRILARHLALLLHLVASAVFLVGFRARACSLVSTPILPSAIVTASGTQVIGSTALSAEKPEDEELKAAFEQWKSKTFALSVPLRIVALRGSIPPSWTKDFIQAQGRRLKLKSEVRGSLESICTELTMASDKGSLEPKSTMAADIVSIGDSWLGCAINGGLVEPIPHVEEQDWFKGLSNRWKVHLCRNSKGELDSNGFIWGAPYRWGTMVIAYKKKKFKKHNLAPIEDWGDLWRPELSGKISMVDSPREVVGAVLKHMGESYNTKDIDSQVLGGRKAVMHNLAMLQRQVRLFDSVHYLKAFGAGDVWVAVGWSSDVIPAAKRLSNVAVIVPKSGASLWADLWAIPAASRFTSNRIGGRIRSPSPLIHQWIEFCLQTARGLPFQQQVIPGASPFALEQPPVEDPQESTKGKPKLDTNLIGGVPPPEILSRCEFLEPLSEKALEDHRWLISGMQKPTRSWIRSMMHNISLVIHTNRSNPQSRQ